MKITEDYIWSIIFYRSWTQWIHIEFPRKNVYGTVYTPHLDIRRYNTAVSVKTYDEHNLNVHLNTHDPFLIGYHIVQKQNNIIFFVDELVYIKKIMPTIVVF